jgi:DNA-binding LytR/AlgR family response regulator
MNILIIEDEQATARHTRKMLEEIDPDVNILGILDSIESTVKWFRSHSEPDLLILDIHLADGSSFEIFKEISIACPVIFTTAYDQYAIQAFKVNSIDYLLKPISKEALTEALKKYRKISSPFQPQSIDYHKLAIILTNQTPEQLKRVMIRYGETIKAIDIKDVAYFQTEEKIVFLRTFDNKNYPVDFSMDELEHKLVSTRWFRINRQFIISFESIEKMTAYSKSRIKITLRPPCENESISSTERSGDFKLWLAGK